MRKVFSMMLILALVSVPGAAWATTTMTFSDGTNLGITYAPEDNNYADDDLPGVSWAAADTFDSTEALKNKLKGNTKFLDSVSITGPLNNEYVWSFIAGLAGLVNTGSDINITSTSDVPAVLTENQPVPGWEGPTWDEAWTALKAMGIKINMTFKGTGAASTPNAAKLTKEVFAAQDIPLETLSLEEGAALAIPDGFKAELNVDETSTLDLSKITDTDALEDNITLGTIEEGAAITVPKGKIDEFTAVLEAIYGDELPATIQEPKEAPAGGGGCSAASFGLFALALVIPFVFKKKKS